MTMQTKNFLILFLSFFYSIAARSPHRPEDPTMPRLTTCWAKDTKTYTLKNNYLQEYALFETFDYEHFVKNYLPMGPITYRNQTDKKVDGSIIAHLIDDLIQELHSKKRIRKIKHSDEFKHFTILRNSNFNRHERYGFLILKCKDYPFVVKLSIETPEGLTNPFKKGFEPSIFFVMAGGSNRHFNGFTRIKNANNVRKAIAQADFPVDFDIPRKWFYVPQNCKWIELKGTNIGKEKEITKQIPGTYCIIADAIDFERKYSLFYADDRTISMELCNLVNFAIDPHIDNFLVEKGTNKVVIIDTEHFPSMTGLTNTNSVYTSQIQWYADLSIKCAKDLFSRDKKTRRYIQRHGTHHYKL